MTNGFEGSTEMPEPPQAGSAEGAPAAPPPPPEGLLPLPPMPGEATLSSPGRPKRRTVVIAAAVAAAVVGGIVAIAVASSGSGQTAASPTQGLTVVPAGWSVHRDADNGFAIAYPDDWQDVTEPLRANMEGDSEIFKFAAAGSTGTSLNVVVEEVLVTDLVEVAKASQSELESGGATNFSQSSAVVPAGPAAVLEYDGGASDNRVHVVQYFLAHGNRGYVVTFGGPAGTEVDSDLVRQCMNSLELFD